MLRTILQSRFKVQQNHLTIQRYLASNSSVGKRICIVGAGPAGFYAAQYLLKLLQDVKVDVIDKLPVPFGLVR